MQPLTYEVYRTDVTLKSLPGQPEGSRNIKSYIFIPQYPTQALREAGTLHSQGDTILDAARVVAAFKHNGHDFVNGTETTKKSTDTRDIKVDGLPPDEFERLISEANRILAGN